MVITLRRIVQVPGFPRRGGGRLQRLQKGDQGGAIGGGEALEPVPGSGGFAAVGQDGLLERRVAAVVQERLGIPQIDQRLGAELGRGRQAETDVGEIGPHVVKQEVGIGGEFLVSQRGNRTIAGAERRNMAGCAPDLREQLAAPTPWWFVSSGSAEARTTASGTASSRPRPNTTGVVRWARVVAEGGHGSESIPRACFSAAVVCPWLANPPSSTSGSHTPFLKRV